jgi:hypothetical protein
LNKEKQHTVENQKNTTSSKEQTPAQDILSKSISQENAAENTKTLAVIKNRESGECKDKENNKGECTHNKEHDRISNSKINSYKEEKEGLEDKDEEKATATMNDQGPGTINKEEVTKQVEQVEEGDYINKDIITQPEKCGEEQTGTYININEKDTLIDEETVKELIQMSKEYKIQEEKEEATYQNFLQENSQDAESIASKKTLLNNNINNYSDKESITSPNKGQEFEIEDDENTVDSSNSTQYNKKASDKEVPPRCIRYQIGINISKTDIQTLQKEFENSRENSVTSTDTFSKIRDHLKELIMEIKKLG